MYGPSSGIDLTFEQLLNLVACPLLQQPVEQVCGLGRQHGVVDRGDVFDTFAQLMDVAVGHRLAAAFAELELVVPITKLDERELIEEAAPPQEAVTL